MIFADTNILVYAVDPSEGSKCDRAVALLGETTQAQQLVLSTQVLQEFYVTVLRRRLMPPADALVALRAWSENIIVPSTGELVIEAAELQQRMQLSLWDALVVQAALSAGCSTLFTEDLQHGMRIGELEIVNPFNTAVHEPTVSYGVPTDAKRPSGVRSRRKTS